MFKVLAAIIAMLVVMMILLMFDVRIGELYQDSVNKNVCKASVRSQDALAIKNIALDADIKCPLQRIEIKEINPEKIKGELAKLYYDVCDEFGQGTLNLFGKRETTFCVIRDRITFKNKGIIINDFGKYLIEKNALNEMASYAEFCSGYKTERAVKIFDKEIEQIRNVPIDTNKEYVIMFVYAKGEEEIREAIKFFFGASDSHITMYIGGGLIVGGGALVYTGYGTLVGVPLVIAGKAVAGAGLGLFGGGAIINYFTNKDIKMEWASFFLIREFNEQELKQLPCDYLPAEQS